MQELNKLVRKPNYSNLKRLLEKNPDITMLKKYQIKLTPDLCIFRYQEFKKSYNVPTVYKPVLDYFNQYQDQDIKDITTPELFELYKRSQHITVNGTVDLDFRGLYDVFYIQGYLDEWEYYLEDEYCDHYNSVVGQRRANKLNNLYGG